LRKDLSIDKKTKSNFCINRIYLVNLSPDFNDGKNRNLSETGMGHLKNKYGDWALVAGAALGLGEAYSTQLAKQGINIVMVDNQLSSLTNLSAKLENTYSIKTVSIHADLLNPDSIDIILETIKAMDCRLFIYNAAFSRIKKFTDHSPDELEHFLHVNIGSQLKLVHAFSKMLLTKKQKGGIILMSSLAGLLGMQLIAPYAASKAFAWNLAEALHHEFKPNNIDVIACVAGATATEAYLKTNPKYGVIKAQVQMPEVVAESALKKLGKQALYISGRSNRFNYFILTRVLPRKMAARIANATMWKMYRDV